MITQQMKLLPWQHNYLQIDSVFAKVLTNQREYKLSALEMLKWRGSAKLKESIQYKRIICELYVHFYI